MRYYHGIVTKNETEDQNYSIGVSLKFLLKNPMS